MKGETAVYIVRNRTKIRPFISPTDSAEVRKLKRRCMWARREAARGRVRNPESEGLAEAIDFLRQNRQRQHVWSWSPAVRKFLIKDQEAPLARALLKAAEQGTLLEVARLLDRRRRDGPIANPGQFQVIVAYCNQLASKGRPPFIGELLKQLGIEKPKRTRENEEQWFQLNSRERVIRETLKRFNLPLSRAKRGRH